MIDFNSLLQASQQRAQIAQRQAEADARIKALIELYEAAVGQGAIPSMHASTDANDPGAPLAGGMASPLPDQIDPNALVSAVGGQQPSPVAGVQPLPETIPPSALTGAISAGMNPQSVAGVNPPSNPGAVDLSSVTPAPVPPIDVPYRGYETSKYGADWKMPPVGPVITSETGEILSWPPKEEPAVPAVTPATQPVVPPVVPSETPVVTNPPTTAAASAAAVAPQKSTIDSLAGMRFENAIAAVAKDSTLQEGAKTAILEALVTRQVESAKNAATSPFANVVPQDWDKDVDWTKLGVSRSGTTTAGTNQPATANGSVAQTTQAPNVAGATVLAPAPTPAQAGLTFHLGDQLGGLKIADAINAVQQGEGAFLYVSASDRNRIIQSLKALQSMGDSTVPKTFGGDTDFELQTTPQSQGSGSILSGSVKPEERQMK